jgi:hypothetical protein
LQLKTEEVLSEPVMGLSSGLSAVPLICSERPVPLLVDYGANNMGVYLLLQLRGTAFTVRDVYRSDAGSPGSIDEVGAVCPRLIWRKGRVEGSRTNVDISFADM